jgi:hypothetical protein
MSMVALKSISLLALGSSLLLAGALASPAKRYGPAKLLKKAHYTYAEDIAPILNEHCVQCHRPDQVAPFSLIGYENAKKWAAMVTTVTESKKMPPWKAVHGFGDFSDENVLTADQIAILKTWTDDGAPRGDATKEPKPPTFSDRWSLGKPDMVLTADKPFKVDADGPDIYRNFVLKQTFDKPTWVTAMDVQPGNRKVVHHVIVYIDHNGQASKLEAANKDGQEGFNSVGPGAVQFDQQDSLGGWAPGLMARKTPEGTAFLVTPGSHLVLQIHYHKTGKPEEDLTHVALYFAKEPPQRQMRLAWIFNFKLDIPAGEKEYHLDKWFALPADVTVYTVMPHMHLLGRQMKATATLPDGTEKPLVYVDNWDFNWQLTYPFREPVKLPKGSRIHVEATYDNSVANANNPHSPPVEVRWGEQTTDEMFLLIAAYTVDNQVLPAGK